MASSRVFDTQLAAICICARASLFVRHQYAESSSNQVGDDYSAGASIDIDIRTRLGSDEGRKCRTLGKPKCVQFFEADAGQEVRNGAVIWDKIKHTEMFCGVKAVSCH